MTDLTNLEQIAVRVVLAGRGEPARGAAILLRVKVPKKNPYAVGPSIADLNGEVVFTRDEIEEEIALCKETSPMDYQGELDDAIAFEAEVMGANAIESLISARKIWGSGVPEWRLSDEDETRLRASGAEKWEPSKSVQNIKQLNEIPKILRFDLSSLPMKMNPRADQ